MSRNLTYLADILQAARLALTFVDGMTRTRFLEDLMCQSAVIRQIEIIGEATKRLSEAFRKKHPEIPWRQMAGMRDLLLHAYDHVDLADIAWVDMSGSDRLAGFESFAIFPTTGGGSNSG